MADVLHTAAPCWPKRCSRCGVAKSIASFGIRRASHDGLSPHCRSCQKEKGRFYRDRYRVVNEARDARLDTPIKRCCRCQEELPSTAFDLSMTKKDGLHDKCRECKIAYERDKHFASFGIPRRRRMLWAKYKMTLEDYERLFAEQAGRCAICRGTDPGDTFKAHLAVDHDHATGAVRGLLCSNCNKGIGNLGDDPERLRVAAAYLEGRK